MNEKPLKWIIPTSALGIIISILYIVTFQFFHNDHVQLLTRAQAFVDGSTGLLSYGVAAGGHLGVVPGPLINWLVVLPYALFPTSLAPMLFILLLHIISFFMIYQVLKKEFSPLALIIYAALFWLLPWRASEVVLWNISYLFFFGSLHFYTGSFFFSKKHLSSSSINTKLNFFWPSFFHILCVTCAFQIHYSAVILLFTSLLVWRWQKISINWYGVIMALLLTALILSGFIQDWFSGNLPVSPGSQLDKDHRYFGRGFVTVAPILKAITYWVRYCTTYPARSIVKFIPDFWQIVTLCFGIITILISVYCSYSYWKLFLGHMKNQSLKKLPYHWIYYLCTVGGSLLATGLSSMTPTHWHLLIIFHAALIPTSFVIASLLESSKQNISKNSITYKYLLRYLSRSDWTPRFLWLGLLILLVWTISLNIIACYQSEFHHFSL